MVIEIRLPYDRIADQPKVVYLLSALFMAHLPCDEKIFIERDCFVLTASSKSWRRLILRLAETGSIYWCVECHCGEEFYFDHLLEALAQRDQLELQRHCHCCIERDDD